MKKRVLPFLFFVICGSVAGQPSLNGNWEGSITIQEQEMGIIFHIEGEDGNYSGTLDIAAQGASDLSLIYVVVKEDSVSTAFNTGSGIGEFKGRFVSQNNIEGSYIQSGSVFSFQVERQNPSTVDVVNPGAGRELIIKNGDIDIAGTLVVPESVNQAPIVILLSGSGAQNRDSEIVGFKLFADMAEHLKSQGIASFRFDDREIGQSTGNFTEASLSILASDVNSIIQFLQDSVDIQFGDTILLGHSQGGVVAGRVASSNSDIDQLILMASPSVSMMNILRFQVHQAYEKINVPEETIQNEITAREDLMRAIVYGDNIYETSEIYKNAYRQILNSLTEEQLQAVSENKEEFIERQANQLVSFYSTPQMQSLLFYNPAKDLSNLSIPVLFLFGGKDTQVSEELNEPPARKALNEAETEFEVAVIENANHLFQHADTGDVNEYFSLEKEFTDGFLSIISSWIHSH